MGNPEQPTLFGELASGPKAGLESGYDCQRSEWIKEFADMRPPGGFRMIMADNPWRQEMWSEEGEDKSPQAHYDVMSVEEMCSMPVDILAARDCLLYFWCISNMVPQALQVIDAWGFEYKTMGWWGKYNRDTGKLAFGMGYILRGSGEPYIIATRGEPKTVSKSVRNTMLEKRRKHSEKPNKAYSDCEALMPGVPKLELFSRTNRPGWTSWGKEAGTLNQSPALRAAE